MTSGSISMMGNEAHLDAAEAAECFGSMATALPLTLARLVILKQN